MQNTFLRTDERLDFGSRVEVHIIPALVPVRHGLAEFGDAHRGLIAMHIGTTGLFAKHVDGLFRGRHVGASDAQANHVLSFGIHLCHFLQLPAEIIFADIRQSVGWLDVIGLILLLHILLKF